VRNGRFSLQQSGDLWRLLVGIVLKKLYHQIARHKADKRSIDREQPLPAGGDSAWPLAPAIFRSPTTEQAVEIAELVDVFVRQLDSRSRRIFELRLQDQRIEDIAASLALNERTVRRTLDQLELRLKSLLQGTDDPPERTNCVCSDSVNEVPEELTDSEKELIFARENNDSQVAVDRSDMNLEVAGTVLSDRDFVIEMHLGSGATGRVYRARRKCDNHLVAIKMLRKKSQCDPAAVARFLDEAHTVARLVHPGIVPVQGIGRTRRGGYFLVYELVRGENLANRSRERPITLQEASRWVTAAADAVNHAHNQGVVHCDLKPANLLLDSDGRLRVTDFGLAQIITPGAASRSAVAGTFGYMATEQLDSTWGEIGRQTDVFGLGAVLFSLLAGRPPFCGNTIGELFHSMLETAPNLSLDTERPDVPIEFAQVIRTCVSLKPGDRFQSARDLADALRSFDHS
jgi:tRNA A-37 threonylcarbamoyl transferase component Bud32/DNA-directed RNA polymerase specialized sigma24 family protein